MLLLLYFLDTDLICILVTEKLHRSWNLWFGIKKCLCFYTTSFTKEKSLRPQPLYLEIGELVLYQGTSLAIRQNDTS